jgi:hypothetical protein
VFGPDGSPRRDSLFTYYTDSAADRGVDRTQILNRHLDQADHVDDLIVQAIDALLASSATPPVIVVFSDHGPGSGFDHRRPLESDSVERTSNIMAAFTPGHPALFTGEVTPTEIMPTLLNAYLGTSIDVPGDSVWAWKSSKLDFIELSSTTP